MLVTAPKYTLHMQGGSSIGPIHPLFTYHFHQQIGRKCLFSKPNGTGSSLIKRLDLSTVGLVPVSELTSRLALELLQSQVLARGGSAIACWVFGAVSGTDNPSRAVGRRVRAAFGRYRWFHAIRGLLLPQVCLHSLCRRRCLRTGDATRRLCALQGRPIGGADNG